MKLAEQLVRTILDRIADGTYTIGQDMPAETELAHELGVSRLTLREAIKDLAARGVLEVRHGKRNRLASTDYWMPTDPLLLEVRSKITGNNDWHLHLMEARHIIEVGAAELAANRISNEQLSNLKTCLTDMRAANETGDAEASVLADMNFHRLIIEAANNSYVTATYDPLEQVLEKVRHRTSSSAKVRADAEAWHQKIYDAIADHSPAKARAAMRGHMRQTLSAVKEHS